MAVKQLRNPNVPVLTFEIGATKYEVLVAGPKDFITCAHNPKHNWSPNSLIVREYHVNGLREVEHDLHDPSTWGWIGRLMATGQGMGLKQTTPTDMDIAGFPTSTFAADAFRVSSINDA